MYEYKYITIFLSIHMYTYRKCFLYIYTRTMKLNFIKKQLYYKRTMKFNVNQYNAINI